MTNREMLAILVAPLAPAIITVVTDIITSWSWPYHYELPLIIAVSSVFSYLMFALVGLPFIAFLRCAGKHRVTLVLLGGIVFGGLAGILFVVGLGELLGSLSYTPNLMGDLAGSAMWGAGHGVSVAATYCIIVWGLSKKCDADDAHSST